MTVNNSRQTNSRLQTSRLRVGLVVPHIFMQEKLLPQVIFSPGRLALELAEGLGADGIEVVLFSPGPVSVDSRIHNVTADLSYFQKELAGRGDTYLSLLKKHPLTFVTLARQVQAELIAKAYEMANEGELDIVHIYTNEEDLALPFAALCHKPVVLTHHDPFNFLIGYKNVFPKYKALNWISISLSQRLSMPSDTNWVGNVYHGLDPNLFEPSYHVKGDYVAYLGRIIEPKGLHLAIAAVKEYNRRHSSNLVLKIAGKHYAGQAKDGYWQTRIAPEIDGHEIQYVGFLDGTAKTDFLRDAHALLVPSIFAEPFGLVAIESLACATPIIALDSGALPEIIDHGVTGQVVHLLRNRNSIDLPATINGLVSGLENMAELDRRACREAFERRFTLQHMTQGYAAIYRQMA